MSSALNWPLGDYLIVREIDRGQFGTVYEATHAARPPVALKLIPLDGPDSAEKVAAERQGATLQQRFSRAYAHLVPEVFEHQPLGAYYAVAMELVRGEPLTTQIARAPIPAGRAARIAVAIATFLEKAHQFKTEIEGLPEIIVHGDLKPAHVLLIPDGTIRVLDFGIAKALAARKPVTTNRWGSIDYASPERLESGQVNEHADFWSLGVILFEMAGGYRPYRQYEGSPSRLESAIRRQEPRAPLPPDVDPVMAAIIDKLLSPQPERRYGSASAIAADLTALIAGGSTVAAAERARASQQTMRLPSITAPSPSAAAILASPGVTPSPAEPTPSRTSVPTEPMPRPPLTVPPPLPKAALSQKPPSPGTLSSATLSQAALPHAKGTLASWTPPAGMVPPETTPSRAPARPVTSSRRRLRALVFNIVKLMAAVVLVSTVAAEGAGLVQAQRLREEVPSLEASDVAAARAGFRRIRAQTPLGLGTMRVRGPLRDRMIELANRTILEFRTDAPALARAQWEETLDCLDLAREVAPRDITVAGKQRYVQGRLAWMRARTRANVDEAIRLLRDSARLDPASPDPYLGLATIFAYSTHDLPALTEAIGEAEKRGYRPGRRERAELGDVHKVLADRARARARTMAGVERAEQMQAAAAYYAKCVEYFDGLHIGESESSIGVCRSRLRDVAAALERMAPPEADTADQPSSPELPDATTVIQ
jgi:serine/threonine-protein kinase